MKSKADLYLDQLELRRYCPESSHSTNDCHDLARPNTTCVDNCPLLNTSQRTAFRLAFAARDFLPSVPLLTVPRPMQPGIYPINEPGENALVLISGNSRLTFEVLTTVWAQGITPAYFVLVNCWGHTVDMAVNLGEFTVGSLRDIMESSELEKRLTHRHMIIPGLTAHLAENFRQATGWEVEVGPVCAAELPLFLKDRWWVRI